MSLKIHDQPSLTGRGRSGGGHGLVDALAVREQQELSQQMRTQLIDGWLFEHVGEALAVLSEEYQHALLQRYMYCQKETAQKQKP